MLGESYFSGYREDRHFNLILQRISQPSSVLRHVSAASCFGVNKKQNLRTGRVVDKGCPAKDEKTLVTRSYNYGIPKHGNNRWVERQRLSRVGRRLPVNQHFDPTSAAGAGLARRFARSFDITISLRASRGHCQVLLAKTNQQRVGCSCSCGSSFLVSVPGRGRSSGELLLTRPWRARVHCLDTRYSVHPQ